MLETCKANGLLPASLMNAGNEPNDFCAKIFCAASFLPLRIYFLGMLYDASSMANQPTPPSTPVRNKLYQGKPRVNKPLIIFSLISRGGVR